MRAAYQAADWTPGEVDYIECHGAGTPTGDRTELASLRSAAGARPASGRVACTIGSVKSMIGHLLTAAGAAGAIRTLLAMRPSGPAPDAALFIAPGRQPARTTARSGS